MTNLAAFVRNVRGTAAAELALVLPLLLIIMFGSFEIGNYFRNEHILVKAVRDGARFAARQNFDNYTACSGAVSDPLLTNTRNVVKTGVTSGGTDRLPSWTAATISVTMTCATTAGGQSMTGIYKGRSSGAPTVTVSATVPYTPVLHSFGFSGIGMNLNASQQAAVMGI
jgi:Flp pilus assembly protein TadG